MIYDFLIKYQFDMLFLSQSFWRFGRIKCVYCVQHHKFHDAFYGGNARGNSEVAYLG